MRYKAEQGYVTGSKVFGYDNHRIAKGQVERRINDAEAAVVREVYERFADGEGARSIALRAEPQRRSLARARSRAGRTAGVRRACAPCSNGRSIAARWSTARARKPTAANSASGTAERRAWSPRPEDRWLRLDRPELRIVDADVAARVDARREDRKARYVASLAKGGRVPERAHGKYLLSGGLLVCPQCGGHFEARIAPWKGHGERLHLLDAAAEARRLHEHPGAAHRRDRRRRAWRSSRARCSGRASSRSCCAGGHHARTRPRA